MYSVLRQQVALVLIAVMALLPMQNLLAAGSPATGGHCPSMQSAMLDTQHQMPMSHSGKGDCCPNDAAKVHGGSHQCDNNCDHCDDCGYATALTHSSDTSARHFRDTLSRTTETSQVTSGRSDLFRPPILSA